MCFNVHRAGAPIRFPETPILPENKKSHNSGGQMDVLSNKNNTVVNNFKIKMFRLCLRNEETSQKMIPPFSNHSNPSVGSFLQKIYLKTPQITKLSTVQENYIKA